MARRKKAEAKTSVKQQTKSSAVRKSSRQRAKKQLEEQKVNGDVTSSVVSSDDCKDFSDDNHELNKKVNTVPKKLVKHKNFVDKGKSVIENENIHIIESDSQDDVETDSHLCEKLQFMEEVKHVNSNENTLNEVAWPEDIIEETIICEEMEVETELNDDCSSSQAGRVLLEEVLLVNDPNFAEKDIVEYTVIQNEDGSESMLVPSNASENVITITENATNSISCFKVEQDLRALKVSDPEIVNSSDTIETVAISKNNELSDTSLYNFDNSDSVQLNDNVSISKESRSLRSATKSSKNSRTKNNEKNSDKKKKTEKFSRKVSESEDKGLTIDNKEKVTKSKKSISLNAENLPEQNNIHYSLEQLNHNTLESQEYCSSSIPNKVEHSEVSSASLTACLKSNKIISNGFILQHKNISCQVETKVDNINSSTVKPKHVLFVNEEQSRDSELDGKIDSEDVKLSSSSENSSDTLLSSNSCKVLDFNAEKKSTSVTTNEIEKKTGFRSRSGSTDTTGSESGSNSSGVRRSNRIRTIGLMKQRSRGRGVVTKPSLDSTKVIPQQDQDKSLISTLTQDLDTNQNKDNLQKISETPLDKENSNKASTTQDVAPPSTCSTGYDSDTNKPVKVKSRWRRSSELEMSNSGSWLTPRSNVGFTSNNPLSGTSASTVSSSLSDTGLISSNCSITQEPKSKAYNSDSGIAKNFKNEEINVVSNDSLMTENLASTSCAVIPKAVGAKISLPMVPEIHDREMEERLSQFEDLKENLYLTERYTSKETKRMVCDCFLTEDEIQRDELGCGEDCLNRLLMIECGSRCIVGDRCTNKRFQNCEYANCEVFRTEKKGFGLRATTDLKAGEFIMEYVGEVVDPKDFRRRAKEYSKDKNRHYYFMALKSDQIIDATMKGNISRFINHSCDPNAETQKWTVNGELRIGFFNTKFVAAGEEITFDYHFQRYGEEAQKCFCEASNCRGWIGDNPNDNKEKVKYIEDLEDDSEDDIEDKEDKENKEEKPKKQIRRKRDEKKVTDHMEDEDLEEQIDKLCSSGLKNRAHTLTLSRLMVRCRELQHRTRLLKVIQSGEQPCRRLFLDYHGLRLMWSYMMDVAGSASEEAQQFRLEILKTLSTLPIPNRTMLIDSKVLNVIEKWSRQLYHSTSGDSPEDDQSKLKSSNDEVEMDTNDVKSSLNNVSNLNDKKKEAVSEVKSEESRSENLEQALITELAGNLLVEWSNLKEVFRIPKKERLEQMKEHEREADRGYKEDVEKEAKESSVYERPRTDRYSRNEVEKRGERVDRRRGRDSPEFEHNRSKEKRGIEDRPNLVQVPRMSKFERRQLFAMKVAKEEEERQRRQQEESWQQHEAQCLALGLDPYTTAAIDSQSGYPLFFNPQLAQWQAYPMQANTACAESRSAACPTNKSLCLLADQNQSSELSQQCTPVYVPAMAMPGPTAPIYAISQLPSNYGHSQLVQIHNGATPPLYSEKALEPVVLGLNESEHELSTDSKALELPAAAAAHSLTAPPPSLDLPPKWRWARDKRGRLYYYHIKERISQWLPPPPEHIAAQADSSTTSESSDESSSSNEEEDEDLDEEQLDEDDDNEHNEQSEEHTERQLVESMELDLLDTEMLSSTCQISSQLNSQPEVKKRRDGLVQERIISPRREEDRVDHKKYKEIKEKLKRQKERAKLKEHLEKMRKHRRSSKSKHVKHSTSKFQPITSDMSPTTERKIKDTFRINMANVMVHFLNPYRKNDCKQGRITNTEDFKHLARKLTHFVLAKELKHCKSVDELECNDNVKHKAKDFVRKYMSKFGAVYQKGTDED